MNVYDPKQIPTTEVLDENQRIARAWGTVEVRDKQGHLLPVEFFKKIMPVLMERGAPIIDEHSNKQVGRVLDYEFKENPKAKANGVYLTYKIYSNYPTDAVVWDEIKSGKRKGLSFGGGGKTIDLDFSKGEMTAIFAATEGYEFSSVIDPANSFAVNEEINYIAKSGSGLGVGGVARQGNPKTDEERRQSHGLGELPARGTGLSEKLKEFVEKVSKSNPEIDAYAVCTAALGEQAFKSDSVELQVLKSFTGGEQKMADVKKQEAPAEEEAPASVEERVGALESAVAAIGEQLTEVLSKLSAAPIEEAQKQEGKEEKEEGKEEKKEEKKEEVQKTEEVKKEGDGENVVLPKSEEEKTTEEGKEPKDAVTVVEKTALTDLKKEIIEDVKKSLGSSSVPRPDSTAGVDTSGMRNGEEKGLSAYDIAVGKKEFDSRKFALEQADAREEKIKGILANRGGA